MSHEFRTPLNSILALSRLLLGRSDGELTAEQEKQVQFIRKAAETLTELVNDLLDLAKVEAGKTVITPAEFRPRACSARLRGMLRPLLVGDAVALMFDDPDDLPPLRTDEGKVSQISATSSRMRSSSPSAARCASGPATTRRRHGHVQRSRHRHRHRRRRLSS